jgi:hypothetical protein
MTMRTGLMASVALLATALSLLAVADGPPKTLKIDGLVNLWGAAEFDHALHAGVADSCKDCHHKPFGKPMACADCHDQGIDPKSFDHGKHSEYDTCTSCHQVQSTKELACGRCHKTPFDEDNLAVPGLKGAYHARCMGCHARNGVANACETCHEKR